MSLRADTWSCQRKNKRKDSRVVDVEDDLIQIRTNKHQEVLFKKLKEVHTRSDNTSSPIISDAVDATATALPVINTVPIYTIFFFQKKHSNLH